MMENEYGLCTDDPDYQHFEQEILEEEMIRTQKSKSMEKTDNGIEFDSCITGPRFKRASNWCVQSQIT